MGHDHSFSNVGVGLCFFLKAVQRCPYLTQYNIYTHTHKYAHFVVIRCSFFFPLALQCDQKKLYHEVQKLSHVVDCSLPVNGFSSLLYKIKYTDNMYILRKFLVCTILNCYLIFRYYNLVFRNIDYWQICSSIRVTTTY